MINKYRFSVWTPTYNRAEFLNRLYLSLVNQTFNNFEWIIIDDGSTDNTSEIINNFIMENKLKSIRYIQKENGGKHTAWRIATNEFKANYVVTIDSDDTLEPRALEIFDKEWSKLEKSSIYNNFWEIKGRTIDEKGKLIGNPLPKRIFDTTNDRLIYKYRIEGEMHACRKTCVLKNEARVPDNFTFENLCSNFPEGIRWSNAGKLYKSRFIEENIRTYYTDATDTLTKSNIKNRSAKKTYNNLITAKYSLEISRNSMLRWDKISYIKNIIVLLYTSMCLSLNPIKILSTNYLLDRGLLLLLYVPTYLLFKIRG